MTEAIVLEQVSKTFPHASMPSLREVSLSIETGRFVTILGGSGSGKTTLLRLMNRLIEPSSGRILVNGEDTGQIPPAQLRRRIGYVIQQIGLFPHMTVHENIATVPKLLGWDRGRINARVRELLDLVGLDPEGFMQRYPRQLSGGQQQRVGLARALAAEPALLLMDEPFGALDAITRESLQDELKQIQRRLGTTVVFVTHDVPEALKLGDEVIIIEDGRVQQFASPREILARPANDFVASLVGSRDLYRQLHFVQAGEVMVSGTSAQNGHVSDVRIRTVNTGENLKQVLAALLDGPLDTVLVTKDDGQVVGYITLDSLRNFRQELEV